MTCMQFENPSYTLETLKKKDELPLGVDPARVENFLSPAEFQKVFKMDKAEFDASPAWKKAEMKKKGGFAQRRSILW